jgi:fructokinase
MILVCGEALIDLFVSAHGRSEMSARAVAGGSAFNVAIGLARLGVRTAFLSGIWRDQFGVLLTDRLACEGMDDGFLVRTDRPSTISIVARSSDGQPNYAFRGEGAADRSLQLAQLPGSLPDDIQAQTFGSYSMAVETVGTTLAALAQREHGRRLFSIDANIRRAVACDMQSWTRATERFYRTATVIKASEEDVRVASDARLSIADAAAYWLKCGARLVMVTEGAKGATAFSATGSVSVPGRSVIVRDTGRRRHIPRRTACAAWDDRQAPSRSHRGARPACNPRAAHLRDGCRRHHSFPRWCRPADRRRHRCEYGAMPCLTE